MRYQAFCLLLASLVPTNVFATTAQIRQVGLQGYYAVEPSPTSVEVFLTNSESRPQIITLRFRIIDLVPRIGRPTNEFSLSVDLGPSEQRTIAVPLLIFAGNEPVLEFEARDASGELVAQDRRSLEYPLTENLLAIVCVERDICQAVQAEISFSGDTADQTQKGKSLKFVPVSHPSANWWAYSAAKSVVVAAPMRQLSAEQRSALEYYLRQGGQLVLIEDLIQDPSFLAPYRRSPLDNEEQPVGKGTLIRVTKLADKKLGTHFSSAPLKSFLAKNEWQQFQNDELSWLARRLGTTFHFPRLGWLLAWMAMYILIVGVINFAILRRIRRREWGWVTVPALAVSFSVALYVWSAAGRPKYFGVDELGIYWMDGESPLAASAMDLRVSSPGRSTVAVTVPGEMVFNGRAQMMNFTPFSNGTVARSDATTQGWTVHAGPPLQLELSMLQWSFQDLRFHGTKHFLGTVRHLNETSLHNETAQRFDQAIYIDKEKVYYLGTVAAGAEIDLTAARQEPLSLATGRTYPFALGYPATLGTVNEREPSESQRYSSQPQNEMQEWRQLSYHPFELVELIRGWQRDGGHVFDVRSGVFFGLMEEPVLEASLGGPSFKRRNFGLVVVSFGRYQ